MTAPATVVTGGVDTHADVHVAAALDGVGGVLGTRSFPTTAAGYRQLLAWLRGFGELDRVGVEGTGSYGAALARHLTAAGVDVVEVGRPNRQIRRRHGKTDIVDAIAAARAVLSGEAGATPKTHDGPVESLRALKIVARSATKARTQALNQISQLVVTAPDELRARLRPLPRRELLETCAGFRVRSDDDSVAGITRLALRELAHRVAHLDEQLARTQVWLRRITAGDNPDRLHSERSFAALCGASPIPASSGKTTRHRLNRGGDRQANSALWRIAMVRLAVDPTTRAYVARRLADGKTKTEAMRCLKRYIAREVFTALPRQAAA